MREAIEGVTAYGECVGVLLCKCLSVRQSVRVCVCLWLCKCMCLEACANVCVWLCVGTAVYGCACVCVCVSVCLSGQVTLTTHTDYDPTYLSGLQNNYVTTLDPTSR